jgi:hypothetical protein
MSSERRRAQIEHNLTVYRNLYDRLRDVSLPAAREERDRLEQKLASLREERRRLDRPRWEQGRD